MSIALSPSSCCCRSPHVFLPWSMPSSRRLNQPSFNLSKTTANKLPDANEPGISAPRQKRLKDKQVPAEESLPRRSWKSHCGYISRLWWHSFDRCTAAVKRVLPLSATNLYEKPRKGRIVITDLVRRRSIYELASPRRLFGLSSDVHDVVSRRRHFSDELLIYLGRKKGAIRCGEMMESDTERKEMK